MSEQFIGRGWAFPVRVDPVTGGIAMVSRGREIEESIRIVLGTSYGERPMRPEFGSAVHDFIFAPVTPTTAGRLAHEVRVSLARWEPRIRVLDVSVTIDDHDRSRFLIDIAYSIRPDYDRRNLVFPFYVIPEGESELAPEAVTAPE